MPKWLQVILAFVIIIVVSAGLIAALIRSIEREKQASSKVGGTGATDEQSKENTRGKPEVGRGDGVVSAFLPIAPAPLDHQPTFAFDFGEREPNAVLSPSGYPLVTMTIELPACSSPWRAKEAGDAWRQKDQRWLDTFRDCTMLPPKTQAEWTRRMVSPDAAELRVALRDGSRLKLYVPGYATTGEFDQFRFYSLSSAREAAKLREGSKPVQ